MRQVSHCSDNQPEENLVQSLVKRYRLQGIVGSNPNFISALQSAVMIAPYNITVLITGSTGTGKTQLAEIIHVCGQDHNRPFIEVNCASLPENLIENELFGSVAGGHSGAIRQVKGKIQAAEGGTLFLDEIGELSFSGQAKLLQLLHSGKYYAVGASHPQTANVRIITATNIDLKKSVAEKKFREDLFYRIHVFNIHMCDLRDRKSDIPALADYFCRQCYETHKLPKVNLSHDVQDFLVSRHWKGNIRELRNVVETTTIKTALSGKHTISPDDFSMAEQDDPEDQEVLQNFKEVTLRFQRTFLEDQLKMEGWNISKTAKKISLSRAQLNNLIKTFKLTRNCTVE